MVIEQKINAACLWLLQALGAVVTAIVIILFLIFLTGAHRYTIPALPKLHVERVAGRCGWGLDEHWMPAQICEPDSWRVWVE